VELTPKVCILTAGLGQRMGPIGRMLNKALFPLNGKAIISHIFENFPTHTEFVVALGYRGEQVRSYLLQAHPELKITFVDVDPFVGPGSGPGYSAWSCRGELQDPFYFVAVDTFWVEDVNAISRAESWLGVFAVPSAETKNYCNILIKNQHAVGIADKMNVTDPEARVFTGLAYIHEPKIFWRSIEQDAGEGEIQVVTGFKGLIKMAPPRAVPLCWTDLGSEEKYLAAGGEKFASCTKEINYNISGRIFSLPLGGA